MKITLRSKEKMKMSDTDIQYNKWMNASSGVCREWSRGGAYRYFFAMNKSSGDETPVFVERGEHDSDDVFAVRLMDFDFILAIEMPPKLLRVFRVAITVNRVSEYSVEIVAESADAAESHVENMLANGDLDDEAEEDCYSEVKDVSVDDSDPEIVTEDEADDYQHRA